MSMRRYSPFDEIKRIENEITNVFRTLRNSPQGNRFYQLNIDLLENEDEYKIKARVPGYERDDITIEATSQYLEIKVVREDVEPDESDEWVVQELQNLHLMRRIGFDKPVNPSEASTTLKNGMLTITMPKMEEAKSVKLIPETPEDTEE